MTLELRSHGLFDNGLIEMLPVPGSGTWTGNYDPSVVSSVSALPPHPLCAPSPTFPANIPPPPGTI